MVLLLKAQTDDGCVVSRRWSSRTLGELVLTEKLKKLGCSRDIARREQFRSILTDRYSVAHVILANVLA